MLTGVRLQAEVITVALSEPFRIAHGATSHRQLVRVRWGPGAAEGPLVPYYGEDAGETLEWVRSQEPAVRGAVEDLLQRGEAQPMDLAGLQALWRRLPADGPRAGRCALASLLADLAGRAADQPLVRMLGLAEQPRPPACRSLGIPETLEGFAPKVAAAAERFPVLKLKLGSGDPEYDRRIVEEARAAAPGCRLFADANCGWTPAETLRLLPVLLAAGVEFVEQPVARGDLSAWRELRRLMPVPPLSLFADESAQGPRDVEALAGLADGINVKLVKCGGIDRALEMVALARRRGLRVMVGCMIESSLGISAAAHLAPLADLVDLDGHLYLAEDDYMGADFDSCGRLRLPTGPGLGCRERSPASHARIPPA